MVHYISLVPTLIQMHAQVYLASENVLLEQTSLPRFVRQGCTWRSSNSAT